MGGRGSRYGKTQFINILRKSISAVERLLSAFFGKVCVIIGNVSSEMTGHPGRDLS